MSEQANNTERNVRLSPDQIKTPRAGFLERALGGYFRKRADQYIKHSIREFAITPDGGIDNELADQIRKRLTLRAEVSLHRDVVEPVGWAAISGAAVGVGALAISKEVEGKALTRGSAFAAVASTGLGAALDLYRVKRRFDSGLHGALSGAISDVKEQRNPRWDRTTSATPGHVTPMEREDDAPKPSEAKWAQREAERREQGASEERDR